VSGEVHIVLDDTAMIAAGSGNRLVSRLIHRAHAEADLFLYAPACALVEAERARPGTAGHLAGMPAIVVVDLDPPAVLAVARENTWATAHVRYAMQPTPERPDGAMVATADPRRWQGQARVLDVTP
jgi:hypothetical protein